MNYLAHAYLSFHDPAITTGQMIADFVKGKQIYSYNERVQQGIRLHRALDEYTDAHPASRQAKAIFQPACGPYGPVFMDVVYDHFLANDPGIFTLETLESFTVDTYNILGERENQLPPVFQQVFLHMRTHNWLYHYHEMDGIFRSFSGIVRRAKYFNQPATVPYSVFEQHYDALALCYRQFFPDALDFMKDRFAALDAGSLE